MKRIFSIALSFVLMLCLFSPLTAYADTGGSGNVDGGAASVSA